MAQDRWTLLGPVASGGTVVGLASDDQGRFWAATWGGLFREGEGGWLSAPTAPPFSMLGGVWAAGRYLFAAGLPSGLARSADGGHTWDLCWLDEVEAPILSLVASPNFDQDGVLLAGTEGGGVLRSETWGRRWRRANVGLQDLAVTAVACAPRWERREVAFAVTPSGLYRSSSGGRAWKPTSGWAASSPPIQAFALAPWPEEPGFLLFAATEEQGLFRSADGGHTFQPLGGPAPVYALWASPEFARDGLLVLIAGEGVFRSEDGGRTWHEVLPESPSILCLAAAGDRLAAGLQEEGVLLSPDRGRTWHREDTFVGRGLARLAAAGGRLFAFGAMEGAWWTEDGQHWQPLPGLRPEMLPIASLEATEGAWGVVVLAGTAAGLMGWRGDEGPQPLGGEAFSSGGMVSALAFSPAFASDGLAWAGQESGSLWRSRDGGATWEHLGQPFGEGVVVALAPSPRFPREGLLVAATHHPQARKTVLWRSRDGGATWEEWTSQESGWPRVTLVVEGKDGVKSWAGVENLVLQPVYQGWTSHPVVDPPAHVMRVLLTPEGHVMAVTNRGVYRSSNGRVWKPWNEGLPEGMGFLDVAL
ncbi:MAG: WD40/YVTN/BNR-like repeat-containing protein, partial [Anaerolineae bacterium]